VKLVHTAWVLVTDITVGLVIPTMLLWGMKLRSKVKISVHILLGLGSMSVSLSFILFCVKLIPNQSASIATVIRIPYIVESTGLTNKLLQNIAVIFWSIIELAISIITMAAATWKPLLVKLGIIGSYYQNSVRMESVVL
jgi:dipeptide/tripeptide permease